MITSETSYFEIINKPQISRVKCIILDYDGTLTTLRKGWNVILTDYAKSKINPYNRPCDLIDDRILHLTTHAGGTTPRQLVKRLMDIIEELGHISKEEIGTIEHYAKDYADHFQEKINDRLENFSNESESYVIESVRPMLDFIQSRETINYIVTGSCETAVTNELKLLGMDSFFVKVYGATLEMEGNLKLDAMNEIISRHGLNKDEVLIIGDGSTEMRAARDLGLPSIGIASNEDEGGLCQKKRQLLIDLGAHAIIADYTGFQNVWEWLHNETS